MKFEIGDIVITKKVHPCGNNSWTVVRTGADIKIKCNKCERTVMFSLANFDKILKKSGDKNGWTSSSKIKWEKN